MMTMRGERHDDSNKALRIKNNNKLYSEAGQYNGGLRVRVVGKDGDAMKPSK
jgi:hypothetical protein